MKLSIKNWGTQQDRKKAKKGDASYNLQEGDSDSEMSGGRRGF